MLRFFTLSMVMLFGAGCVAGNAPETPPSDEPSCPNVCAAICAGEPEPFRPSWCPIPMCVCESDVKRSMTPTEEERTCERDDECVNADNSHCPGTNADNIVAINKKSVDAFRARRIEPPEGEVILCADIAIILEDPRCINNLCTVIRDEPTVTK